MKKISLYIILIACIIPRISLAADVFFDVAKKSISPNEDFLVQVFLDTKDKKINAVEGSIVFTPEVVDVKDIIDGNSSVNFWIEKPHLVLDSRIVFSGITSGGVEGDRKLLFAAVFHAKSSGILTLSFDHTQVFENNGLGTQVALIEKPLVMSIKKGIDTSAKNYKYALDNNPPEDFIPLRGSDPSVFNGNTFVVFSTVDKGTGVDHYEVSETPWFYLGFWHGRYVRAESPYVTKDQHLLSRISVKALDKNGNQRIVTLDDSHALSLLKQFMFFVIIIIICILFFKKIKPRFFLAS
jgi:hypothetical protein